MKIYILIMTLMVTEMGSVDITSVEISTVELSSKAKCESAEKLWLSKLPVRRNEKQLIVKSTVCVEK